MVEIIEIRKLSFQQWAALYQEYAELSGVEISDEQLRTVWQWLGSMETELRGLAALKDGVPTGLVHYRRFLRPLVGEVGIYLDDIYVNPDARRSGVGKALFDKIESIADSQDCTVIRWITSDVNYEAHEFYNQFGHKTGWITYDHNMDGEGDVNDTK